jgi:hypothetical protein
MHLVQYGTLHMLEPESVAPVLSLVSPYRLSRYRSLAISHRVNLAFSCRVLFYSF